MKKVLGFLSRANEENIETMLSYCGSIQLPQTYEEVQADVNNIKHLFPKQRIHRYKIVLEKIKDRV